MILRAVSASSRVSGSLDLPRRIRDSTSRSITCAAATESGASTVRSSARAAASASSYCASSRSSRVRSTVGLSEPPSVDGARTIMTAAVPSSILLFASPGPIRGA